MTNLMEPITWLADVGGPVLVALFLIATFVMALVFYKLVQFYQAGLGREQGIDAIVDLLDAGELAKAQNAILGSQHFLADIFALGLEIEDKSNLRQRLEAEAEHKFIPLERGFRAMDMIAQLAPLLGLFGTVLGMIEAFQALQEAGAAVDPSILAGGIWVALMTTAGGLLVAMPTSVALAWFESRIDGERAVADHVISVLVAPKQDHLG